jgi:hypothetical protein
MAVPRRHLPGGILGKTIIPVESTLWQIANALMTPVGPVRVAPPDVSGSQPFPQATEEEREEDVGDPIGSKKALVQTNVTAQDMAALGAAMQRMQQDHAVSMAVLHTQLQTSSQTSSQTSQGPSCSARARTDAPHGTRGSQRQHPGSEHGPGQSGEQPPPVPSSGAKPGEQTEQARKMRAPQECRTWK